MIHPCDKQCGNKTASGYCAATACINPQYSNIGTAQYGQGVQKRIVTNYDRIRAMTDEELAEWIDGTDSCPLWRYRGDYDCAANEGNCRKCWLDWLEQEVDDA